jgi:hypothetical protein
MSKGFARYVTTKEISDKLPMCSMFCKHYNDCDKRITLQTEHENEVILVCFGVTEH